VSNAIINFIVFGYIKKLIRNKRLGLIGYSIIIFLYSLFHKLSRKAFIGKIFCSFYKEKGISKKILLAENQLLLFTINIIFPSPKLYKLNNHIKIKNL